MIYIYIMKIQINKKQTNKQRKTKTKVLENMNFLQAATR